MVCFRSFCSRVGSLLPPLGSLLVLPPFLRFAFCLSCRCCCLLFLDRFLFLSLRILPSFSFSSSRSFPLSSIFCFSSIFCLMTLSLGHFLRRSARHFSISSSVSNVGGRYFGGMYGSFPELSPVDSFFFFSGFAPPAPLADVAATLLFRTVFSIFFPFALPRTAPCPPFPRFCGDFAGDGCRWAYCCTGCE